MNGSTKASSAGRWWASPEAVQLRFVAGSLGLALVGLGLLGSGAQGVTSYFAEDPVWFSLLVVSGLLQIGAVVILLAGRGERRVLVGVLPAVAVAAYSIQRSGDWNLMLGEATLSALVVTAWRRGPAVPST